MAWIPMFLILYNFGANLANDIYLPSMPELMRIFSASSNILQLTMTVWFAGVAIPQLIFGPLTDYYGRRPVLFAGGICFLISTIVCAAAMNVWVLVVARFFQGVGVCSLNVSTFSILSDLYNNQNRTQILNKISMCGTVAPLLGPIIGGYVLAYMGWRSNFIIIFVIGLISILGLWFKLPESNLNLDRNALNPKIIYRNYVQLLKNKNFMRHLIPYCLLLGGLVAYLIASPFIIIGNLKVPPQWFGYTQLPVFAVYILGSLYVNYSKDEKSIKKLLILGIKLVFFAGLIMLGTTYLFGDHLLFYILPMIFYSFGFSLCAGPLASEVMSGINFSKGSAAAFLGFGMATSCMLSSLLLEIIYNETTLSVAILLCLISTLAAGAYFIHAETIEVEYEQE